MSLPKPIGPSGAYFESMGITSTVLQQIMDKALSKGGEDCDLYFQHSASTTVQLSDRKISQATPQWIWEWVFGL